ncbi:hypothetical protein NDU88_001340 [Pleurodeles waltl]|uniref:Uncharacterized protein n=1 Tax=Pleurodeles waltl TaxID=8319 RepID=A0AAV7S9I7_PLEWA|nr:hypothetical protein NDU88_001340 [Pleurodeles waltl]
MVITVRGGRRVTQNVSRFRKVVPGKDIADAGSTDEEDGRLEMGGASQLGSLHEDSRSNGVGHNRDPEGASSPDLRPLSGSELQGRHTRYHLRPNPNPSQRLKGFLY